MATLLCVCVCLLVALLLGRALGHLSLQIKGKSRNENTQVNYEIS